MDNLDDSENNAKISDSAYSNSCSNSQSRRSHSSKSTHSGSNSSGSSGYGGKPSTSGSSNTQQPEKRVKGKDTKKKKSQADTLAAKTQIQEECRPPAPEPVFEVPKEEKHDVEQSPPTQTAEKSVELMEIVSTERSSVKDENVACSIPLSNHTSVNIVASRATLPYCADGFSCVISMHDGVVMYTTSSLTTTLGFPKDMWIGRSFIDFIHPRDRNTFASQITNGLAGPKIVNGTQTKAPTPVNSISTMVCRIRRYRGLNSGFGVKESVVSFMPFLLKLTFKDVNDDDGNVIYLVIQATPFFSAFKIPNEPVKKVIPFVMRHSANGQIEYIDPDSVPYLGYLPQDLTDKNVLNLYHPGDLGYLRHVYEVIVKEGGMPRSKPYRIMTQNGDFIRLETEWSSFINPWSRKLEFVTGKHHITEGPLNPDVFQTPEPERFKPSEDEKNKAQTLRENIIRVLNEVLTKPAEVAKQQMSKRCQDLASFMESLMEDQPKLTDEFRLEIQEADNSYYERDSVMLGGISPHHEYNDSKSSTETPLSYNQLNYNETLQRYFDSHQSYYHEEYQAASEDNIFNLNDVSPTSCLSPIALNSGDSGEMSSCEGSTFAIAPNTSSSTVDNYHTHRLTEWLLSKHNAEMEKELMKMHRESRSSKGDREKSNDTRKKKKEHLARCNASFQPTAAGLASEPQTSQPHGTKRTKQTEAGEAGAHKHHCPIGRSSRRKQTSSAQAQPSATITTTNAGTHWSTPSPMPNMNTFILGVGIPQQMSIINPMMPQQMTHMPPGTTFSGMFPMYYAPATATTPIPSSSHEGESNRTGQFQAPAMQYMMYGQAMYGSPFMYSPIAPQVSYPMHQSVMAQSMQYSNTLNPLGLTSRNYEEACKPSLHLRSSKIVAWRDKKRAESRASSSKMGQDSGESNLSANGLLRSSDALGDTVGSRAGNSKSTRMVTSDEVVDRTDGESSYSSFYSSFFKTESGSADDSGGGRSSNLKFWNKSRPGEQSPEVPSYQEPRFAKKIARRKMEPPWVEQVCVTSELIYKYQILTKTMDEVLTADKQKMKTLEQPSLVNEQLGQLYLDLQLEGVAARLTLEEGITSSSSSGEETSTSQSKAPRRKREYSKLMMIYEDDAPLPSPNEDEPVAGCSGS